MTVNSWVKIAKTSDIEGVREALEDHVDDEFVHNHTFNIPLMQLADN